MKRGEYLDAFIDRENKFREIFGQARLTIITAEDRQRLAERIDSQLSPENLTCDGELSSSQVRQRYNFLMGAARDLMAVDPFVTFNEATFE